MSHQLESAIGELLGDKPRYAMGVGTPENFLECIERGIDMFDCVMPTQVARNSRTFVRGSNHNICNAHDARPLDESCGCYVCRNYSQAYIRHLHQCGEILAARLVTTHNGSFRRDTLT